MATNLPARRTCRSRTLGGAGIGDLEAAAGQRVGKIHDGPANVVRAKGVHHDGDAKKRLRQIIGPLLVENHAVLQAGAAALLNIDAQGLGAAFGVRAQLGADFVGGVFGQRHNRIGLCGGIHTRTNIMANGLRFKLIIPARGFSIGSVGSRMSLIDFILNVVGVLLWLNWRAAPLAVAAPAVASLAGTLRPAGPPSPRVYYLGGLAALLAGRGLFYWQVGGQVYWTPRIPLGPITVWFRSDVLERMLWYSFFSFGVALGIFYLCLLLLSWIHAPSVERGPGARLVRAQLGMLDRWPGALKLALPLLVTAAAWCLLHPLLIALGIVPATGTDVWRLLAQGVVIGLGVYLVLKFFLVGVLALYMVNSYVYLGELPLWSFVNATARGLLRPLQWIPLRAGRIDFAPALAMVAILLGAQFTQRVLANLYQSLV